MTKISLLIPDGESTLTKHVVHCLAMDKNIDIHVLSKDPKASISHSRLIKSFHAYDNSLIGTVALPAGVSRSDKEMVELVEFHYYDGTRADELISEIARVVKATGATIIFPIDEHIVKVLSGHKDAISRIAKLAPLSDKSIFEMAINKWELSRFLEGKGVPHPHTVKYSKGTSQEVIKGIKFPVIIKPIDQGNAQGIETFDTPEDLLKFFENQTLKHEYIIQPLIDGYDIDCSVLCKDGKVLTYTIQKGVVSAKVRFRAAVGIEFLDDERVLRTVEKMMGLLNWSGVAHIDLRYDVQADEIKVIEINARYWGSLMGSLNAGINFPLLAVKIVNGEAVVPVRFEHNRYFMGKAPLKQLLRSKFGLSKEKVKLRNTSLYYTLKDPVPVFFELWIKLKNRMNVV